MRWLLGLLAGLLPLAAGAASLDVDPIRVTFTTDNSITVMTLANAGDDPATVQLEPVAWSQDSKGEDVYTPTHDLLATPPIFTVAPHQKQIIRLGLRAKPDPKQERSYRLYLQELPGPQQLKGLGVVMALRIGVPVFVEPVVPAKAELKWSAARVSDKELDLSVTNTSGLHVQIKQVTLNGAGNLSIPVQQAAYVLPGKGRTWALKLDKAPAQGTALEVHGDTDAGPLDGKLVVQ